MTHPNNPYLLKAKAAAKAMEEKLELERQATLSQFERPVQEPYTESEWRAIASATDEILPDADDALEYIKELEIECREKVVEDNQQTFDYKQVKQVVKDFPYYLGDCLVIQVVKYETPLLVEGESFDFEIYRVEILARYNTRYLDIITDTNQRFLGIGEYNVALDGYGSDDFKVSKSLCKSLAIQKYMEEAY